MRAPRVRGTVQEPLYGPTIEACSRSYLGGAEGAERRDDERSPRVQRRVAVVEEDLGWFVNESGCPIFEPVRFLADTADRDRRDGPTLERANRRPVAWFEVGAEALGLGVGAVAVDDVADCLDLD